jgi:hypothetical protein
MDDIESNADAAARPAFPWKLPRRFSLRELLLLTTAIAGLAAAFYTHRPYGPTSFIQSFRPQPALMAWVQSKQPTGLSYGAGGGGGLSIDTDASQQWEMTYHTTAFTAAETLDELRRQVSQALARAGCEIRGRSSRAGSTFGFEYQANHAFGVVWALAYQQGEDIHVFYHAYEHR